MAVNPIIEFFSRDQVPKYCQSEESSTDYTSPPWFLEYLLCHSKSNLPHLVLHKHAEEVIPTFVTSIIDIGLCLPEAVKLSWLRSYKLFQVLPIIRINNSVGLSGIFYFPLLGETFPYQPARGIDLKEGVLFPQQSKVGTRSRHLARIFVSCRYNSQRDFHSVDCTATVNKYSNRHAQYMPSQHTSTTRDLTDRLNMLLCIQPCIRHW